MDELIKWALEAAGKLPPIPVPNIVAFVLVALFLYPLLRKAHKELVAMSRDPPPAAAPIQPESGWLYTVLHDIDVKIAEVNRRLEAIDKAMRRRSRKTVK